MTTQLNVYKEMQIQLQQTKKKKSHTKWKRELLFKVGGVLLITLLVSISFGKILFDF